MYKTLIQDSKHLGLKLVDLQTKDLALKAPWITRLRDRNEEEMRWFYNSYPIKDDRIWRCNTSPKDIKINKELFSVCKNIWKAWSHYHYQEVIQDTQEILNSILWGNSLIHKANAPIWEKQITQSNIDRILDIYDPINSKLISYDQLIESYGTNWTQLQYCSVLAAIPKIWKVAIRNYKMQEPIDLPDKVDILLINKNKPSKQIYWQLIEQCFDYQNHYRPIWQANLNCDISREEWEDIYVRFLKFVKPTKLRSFQYRLLTNSLTINVLRNKWGKNISEMCEFCGYNKETIIHLMYECEQVKKLWNLLEKLIFRLLNVKYSFSCCDICLSAYNRERQNIIHILLIAMKQYIYAGKCLKEPLNFMNFMTKLSKWHRWECIYAQKYCNVTKVLKKWQCIY